ncbi:ATP-dependent DNA ligase [Streptomyces kaempferi]|uniref:ATP-dependent DNA ligase n=1 Tax=Streptomyces kaempferi TaxID=333725 RepID=A0ABW3XG33_9ACTN
MRDEDLFARDVLGGPFTLCPATGDRATALAWLDPAWGAVGIEGVVPKGSEQRYLPGKRTWIRVRSRMTTEVIIAGATGAVTSPASLPPARYDDTGRLRLIARTTPLPAAVRRDLGGRLRAAGPDHPWHGRRFSAGWGTRGDLDHTPVLPELVSGLISDTAIGGGRYRRPVRFLRLREDRQLPVRHQCQMPNPTALTANQISRIVSHQSHLKSNLTLPGITLPSK